MTSIVQQLQAANPHLALRSVTDAEFERYGRLLTHYDPSEMIERTRAILPDAQEVVYETSVAALEAPSSFTTAMVQEVYGGMPTQVGWCYGRNLQMAGLEYHRGSEVDVCVTDAILLLGHLDDIDTNSWSYDTRHVAAFYAPAGSVVELPAWCLHFAPIHTRQNQGFATLVYLPRGTNEPLPYTPEGEGESRMLFAVNKWLLVHPDAEDLVRQGAHAGMVGNDIFVQPI